MSFFRTKSSRSEWKARRKATRREVNEALARADQEQRMTWVNATRHIPEQWTPAMLDRVSDMLAEPGEWEERA